MEKDVAGTGCLGWLLWTTRAGIVCELCSNTPLMQRPQQGTLHGMAKLHRLLAKSVGQQAASRVHTPAGCIHYKGQAGQAKTAGARSWRVSTQLTQLAPTQKPGGTHSGWHVPLRQSPCCCPCSTRSTGQSVMGPSTTHRRYFGCVRRNTNAPAPQPQPFVLRVEAQPDSYPCPLPPRHQGLGEVSHNSTRLPAHPPPPLTSRCV
jgi:hypothetical protein